MANICEKAFPTLQVKMYISGTTSWKIPDPNLKIWLLESGVVRQYGLWSFQRGYKIRKVFAEESTHSKEIIEFWELD